MHSNIFTLALCVLAVPTSVIARPNAHSLSERNIEPLGRVAHPIALRRRTQRAEIQQANQEAAQADQQNQQQEAAAGDQQQEAAEGEEAANGEEEANANEVEIESAFDAAVAVEGGDLKQDLVFTPSTVGKFEFEFQSAAADEILVTENVGAAAAAPPTGFEAIEPNSFTVALSVSKGVGLTLSKIDYIFDAASAGLEGKDVTLAQVGKLCAETGSFVISELLGELEFEVEENEVTLNLNKNVTAEGTFGIFLPVAAVAADAGAAEQDQAALDAAKEQEKAAQDAAKEQDKAAAHEEKAAQDAAAKDQAALDHAQLVAEQEKAAAEKDVKEQEKADKHAAKEAEKAAKEAAKAEEKAAAEAEKPAHEKPAAPEAAVHEKPAAEEAAPAEKVHEKPAAAEEAAPAEKVHEMPAAVLENVHPALVEAAKLMGAHN